VLAVEIQCRRPTAQLRVELSDPVGSWPSAVLDRGVCQGHGESLYRLGRADVRQHNGNEGRQRRDGSEHDGLVGSHHGSEQADTMTRHLIVDRSL